MGPLPGPRPQAQVLLWQLGPGGASPPDPPADGAAASASSFALNDRVCPLSYAVSWFLVHQPVWVGRISTIPPSCQRHGVSRDTGGSGADRSQARERPPCCRPCLPPKCQHPHPGTQTPLSGILERNLCSPVSGKTCFSTRVCFSSQHLGAPACARRLCCEPVWGGGECEPGHSGLQSKLGLHGSVPQNQSLQ